MLNRALCIFSLTAMTKCRTLLEEDVAYLVRQPGLLSNIDCCFALLLPSYYSVLLPYHCSALLLMSYRSSFVVLLMYSFAAPPPRRPAAPYFTSRPTGPLF